MSTNLKYFLGKRRSDLKTYCVKNGFETYEKLIAHLREIGVEFPTLEEYDSVVPTEFKLAELRRPPTTGRQASKPQLEKSVTQKRGSSKSRSRKSTTSKTTRED
tara:strand:+ start:8609 stop:8920 length:312 start_codon:yes stop_codon:yes gene_type:complete